MSTHTSYSPVARSRPDGFGPDDVADLGELQEAPVAPPAFESGVDTDRAEDLAPPPNTETSLTDTAQQLRQVSRVLDQRTDRGRGLVDPSLPRSTYMRRLREQTTRTTDPDRDDPRESEGQTEFGAYLLDVLEEIETRTDRLTARAEEEYENLQGPNLEVVCCIINGIYRIIQEQGGEASQQAFRDVRAVSEDEVRDWIDLLLELLRAYRSTLSTRASGSVLDGSLSFSITLLNKDLSAIIGQALEASLSGMMYAAVGILSDFAERVDYKVRSAIEDTRCAPLMRIWSSIYSFIFGGAGGILGRSQKFLRDTLVRQARQRGSATAEFSIGGADSSAQRQRRAQRIDDLIAILQALRDVADIFDTCRVPEEPRRDEEPREQIQDAVEDTLPDNPIGNDPPGDDPFRDNAPGDPSGPSGGNSPSSPGGGSSTGPFSGNEPRRTEDPDVGPVRELRASREDLLYLTPTNIAKMLASEFGASPEEALDLARNQRCQDQISAETENALQQIGILDTE